MNNNAKDLKMEINKSETVNFYANSTNLTSSLFDFSITFGLQSVDNEEGKVLIKQSLSLSFCH